MDGAVKGQTEIGTVTITKLSGSGMTNADVPFLVKVSIFNLNIRIGAGTNYAKTGKYTGVGVFTITEVKSGTGIPSDGVS